MYYNTQLSLKSVLLMIEIFYYALVLLFAETTDFVLSRKTFVWYVPCQNDCSTSDKDGMRADCSETSFHDSSPVEQRLRNAWFSRECYLVEHILSCLYTTSFAVRNNER